DRAADAADLRVGRRDDRVGCPPELLVELLAGSRADEVDADLGGVLTREADHLLGELDDLDRLAHVEDEDVALAADRAGLDHKRRRLGDRHEEAGHLRMRDRERAALLDLAAKYRDHAARRAGHGPEAPSDEPP